MTQNWRMSILLLLSLISNQSFIKRTLFRKSTSFSWNFRFKVANIKCEKIWCYCPSFANRPVHSRTRLPTHLRVCLHSLLFPGKLGFRSAAAWTCSRTQRLSVSKRASSVHLRFWNGTFLVHRASTVRDRKVSIWCVKSLDFTVWSLEVCT